MTELHLHFTADPPVKGLSDAIFKLDNHDSPTTSTTHTFTNDLTFTSSARIHSGNSLVYRGVLSGHGDNDIKVVCKLLASDSDSEDVERYKHETDVYENVLHELQGRYIPRFYGYFHGSIANDTAICLILEDCGVSLPSIDDLQIGWRCVKCTQPCIH